MKINVFSSGSKGNCSLLRAKNLNILIDLGISKKAIKEEINKYDLDFKDINYVFITHEHTDHVRAFISILKFDNIKFFLTKGTLDEIYNSSYRAKKDNDCKLINQRLKEGNIIIISRIENSILYPSISIEDLDVQILPIFHDAKEPIGFVFEEENKKLCYITDTGYVHRECYDFITNCEAYVLESNHDPEILMQSSRPYQTKMRILSDHGHLSNEDSMCILANVMGDRTHLVMHAHVSEECNLAEIIRLTRNRVFESYEINRDDIEFIVLTTNPTKEYEI